MKFLKDRVPQLTLLMCFCLVVWGLPALAWVYDNTQRALEVSLYGKHTVAGDTALSVDASGNINLNVSTVSATFQTATGSVVDDSVQLVGGEDPSGNAQMIKFDASRQVKVLAAQGASASLPWAVALTTSSGTTIATPSPLFTASAFQISYLSTIATTSLATGSGYVDTVLIGTGGTTSALKLYNDNQCTAGLFATIASVLTIPTSLPVHFAFSQGLCVQQTGAGAALVTIGFGQ